MTRFASLLVSLLCAALLAPVSLAAQRAEWEDGPSLLSPNPNGGGFGFGDSVTFVADQDGDGLDDVLIGARFETYTPSSTYGVVRLYSSVSGAVLHTIYPASDDTRLGECVARLGDLDGDGVDDYAVGAPQASPGGVSGAGRAFVYSGATNALLYRIDGTSLYGNLGHRILDAGDVDGDGVADFWLAEPGADGPGGSSVGAVHLHSGATGALLRTVYGVLSGERIGAHGLDAGRDVDGDGVPDLLVGSPTRYVSWPGQNGVLLVYSGATAGLITTLDFGAPGNTHLGRSLVFVDDLDGDGVDDAVVGTDPAGWGVTRTAYVVSLGQQAVLRIQSEYSSTQALGYSLTNVGDLNGDGHDEVLGARPYYETMVWSPVDGAVVSESGNGLPTYTLFDDTAAAVAAGSDVNGDGVPDLAIGDQADEVLVVLRAADTDADDLADFREALVGTDPMDADTDDDGISDGEEYWAFGPSVGGATNPLATDSDGDGVQDGTELGLDTARWADTDPLVFRPDLDPATTTDPRVADSDGGGVVDGAEDVDANGRVDAFENRPPRPERRPRARRPDCVALVHLHRRR